jgi:hypothetical protein
MPAIPVVIKMIKTLVLHVLSGTLTVLLAICHTTLS